MDAQVAAAPSGRASTPDEDRQGSRLPSLGRQQLRQWDGIVRWWRTCAGL